MAQIYQLINAQKITTLFFILFLMCLYDNWSYTAFVYLALHGTYGYIWMIKHYAFPNKALFNPIKSIAEFMSIFILIFPLYWTIPYFAISGSIGDNNQASPILIYICCVLFIVGIVIMMISDAQTHWILKYQQPRQLITEGMNKYIRHPNYLGETMLYLSFVLLSRHWFPFIVFLIMCSLFYTNNIKKEKSLSRYKEWKQYKKETAMYIPFIF